MLKRLELKVPPGLVTAIAILLMWGAYRLFSDWNFYLPYGRQLTNFLFAAGTGICLLGMITVVRNKTTANPLSPENASRLITSGIFGWTRNPIYLGLFLVVLACAVRLTNPVSLALAFAYPLYLTHFQIIPEERALSVLFGNAYQDYCRKVRRWV